MKSYSKFLHVFSLMCVVMPFTRSAAQSHLKECSPENRKVIENYREALEYVENIEQQRLDLQKNNTTEVFSFKSSIRAAAKQFKAVLETNAYIDRYVASAAIKDDPIKTAIYFDTQNLLKYDSQVVCEVLASHPDLRLHLDKEIRKMRLEELGDLARTTRSILDTQNPKPLMRPPANTKNANEIQRTSNPM